jgi:deoxyhypusine monooxygenase
MSSFDILLPSLRSCLLDLQQPIGKRTHAAFILRTNGSSEAVEVIMAALSQKQDSELMRHELAYILGQMQNRMACPLLASLLEDEHDDVLVRHEAAEALGAIGSPTYIEVLSKYCDHPAREIRETCQIAVDLIKWREVQEKVPKSSYLSVDPAPALSSVNKISELTANLLDTDKSLFHRYRAMFSLRDMNSDDSSLALVAGFQDDSALFRHEVKSLNIMRTSTD